jgi:hypothetical protein
MSRREKAKKKHQKGASNDEREKEEAKIFLR